MGKTTAQVFSGDYWTTEHFVLNSRLVFLRQAEEYCRRWPNQKEGKLQMRQGKL